MSSETYAQGTFRQDADAVMNRTSAGLLAEIFPGVRLTRDAGDFGTLLAVDRAHEARGIIPAHSWRNT